MKSRNFSPWGWLALALTGYILLLGFAYTYFRDRREAIADASDTAAIARDTDIIVPPTLPSTATDSNTTGSNTTDSDTTGGGTTLSTPLLNSTAASTTAATEQPRAELSLPVTDGVVISDDGWVTVAGNISELRFPEYLFIVIQSDSEGRPVHYLQDAIRPDAAGNFSVPVKYGSPGSLYTTFVIGTQDAEAALRLRALGPFADVPPEFDVLSEKSVHLIE